MSTVAIVPVANLAAANTALKNGGYGAGNFSVPAYTGADATHGALHAWHDAAFETALAAIPTVVVQTGPLQVGTDGAGNPIYTDDPVARTKALIEAKGAKWGANAPALPSSGTVTAGSLYRFEDLLWSVIQTFSRTTYSAHPSTYPALIRTVHEPGIVAPWKQPIDQYDAYKLVNPFDGKPDQCTHNGHTWTVVSADGLGNNAWEPGVFGWSYEGYVAPPSVTWVDTTATVAQLVGAGTYRLNKTITGLTLNQAIRLGDVQAGETVFKGYWPTAATPSDYITISPHVTAAVGAKVWKWA